MAVPFYIEWSDAVAYLKAGREDSRNTAFMTLANPLLPKGEKASHNVWRKCFLLSNNIAFEDKAAHK